MLFSNDASPDIGTVKVAEIFPETSKESKYRKFETLIETLHRTGYKLMGGITKEFLIFNKDTRTAL